MSTSTVWSVHTGTGKADFIMKRILIFLVLLTVATMACAATPTVFNLIPINLSNGWSVSGTVTTDGTTGYLSPANILDWNLKIVQTTDMVWTQTNSNDLNISGISTDGRKIYVATSPDGVNDGGTLYFGRPGGRGQIPTNAYIADFTSLGYNLGYGMGGIAGWQDEIAGLNFVGLNQQYNKKYAAGLSMQGRPNVFVVTVPLINGNPLMSMFGSITTDGTLGTLTPQNIKAWNITARTQNIYYMTRTNSSIMAAARVMSTGTTLKVDHIGGRFVIGVSGRRPTFVTVADFTNASYPNGFANYYVGNYGEMGLRSPLIKTIDTYYLAAQK